MLPAIVFLGAGLLLIAFIVSSTQNSVYAMIGIAVSYPVYLLVKRLVTPVGSRLASFPAALTQGANDLL